MHVSCIKKATINRMIKAIEMVMGIVTPPNMSGHRGSTHAMRFFFFFSQIQTS